MHGFGRELREKIRRRATRSEATRFGDRRELRA